MTWPSNSKAATTNVDAGSDRPKDARADIKQNIDNVNAIIDTFDIASPSNGDLLQYNSTSGAWEPISSSTISTAGTLFYIQVQGSGLTGINPVIPSTEWFDPNNIITVSSNQFTLDAGTYVLFATGGSGSYTVGGTTTYVPTTLRNVTDSTDTLNLNTSDDLNTNIGKFTIASSKTFTFRLGTSVPAGATASVSMIVQFIKF